MPTAAKERALTDQLRQRARILLPADRACSEAVVFALRPGCRRRDLPDRFPSPVTCWRRHPDWAAARGLDTGKLFLDTTFVEARKGAKRSARPSAARA
jgi:transposase